MHYMGMFSKAGNIFRQPRALQASNAILQGNLSLTPSKLFVGGLSPTTDVDLLKDVFSRFGKIVDAVIISDRESGVSKGFGFITYDSIDAANTAMQYMNEQELDGRIIGVNAADQGGGGGGFGRRGGYGGGRGGFGRGGFGRGGFGRGGYDFVR
ncbi:glycine-rich RNA-binding protein 6, mitochondrial [Eutrema salsugineum]|uniref:glycine-rich RNA-binding protein 6, mitochondrial n=1 Tax=Eutrema salsugineum TaxID=72664 RepID=UPI000CED2906|nr:glycine-rich RNA-binding protein 6, mitochondrial [Eutrema salsugineum]XP_024009044.1 glycine-rich RNA-binding protein 6, mitochondrial [Eutrema salsugineum]